MTTTTPHPTNPCCDYYHFTSYYHDTNPTSFSPSYAVTPSGGIVESSNAQERALVNTVFSLSGSCISSFIVSSILRPHNKFSMVDIQNATLAGGVAVGSTADMMIQPW